LLRRKLIERGEAFRQIAGNAQDRVAEFAQDFLRPSGTYICCSYSSVVLRALVEAHNHNKHLHIFVLESRPECSGRLMAAELEAHTNHTVSLLYDTAASAVMERCDAVLLGAEALCESGGIINKLGSHTLAIVARSYHRPVLVLAQSFKFTRLFPLSQRDVPQPHALRSGKGNEWWTPYAPTSADISELNLDGLMLQPTKRVPATSRDYTPPEYLSLMITDLGVLSPAAISDELIKLYF
jgi:translation initiation factor eIF-2B subunit alpha